LASFNKFNQFPEDLAKGVHNLSTGSLKWLLTNTAPVATNTVKANLIEISAGNGYSAGGVPVTVSSCTQTSGTLYLKLADVTMTASGGSIGPFRYAVLYNDTPTSPADPLIGWYDYGSSLTVTDTGSLLFDADATNGVLQVT
jgi:hypothetical protein